MGALDKLKSRMSGPGKTPLGRPTEPVSEQVNNNISNDLASAGQLVAQEGVGQGIKKLFGSVASKAFGVAGMLLSSQKAYAGGERKGGTYVSPEERAWHDANVPEETEEEFVARTKN